MLAVKKDWLYIEWEAIPEMGEPEATEEWTKLSKSKYNKTVDGYCKPPEPCANPTNDKDPRFVPRVLRRTPRRALRPRTRYASDKL